MMWRVRIDVWNPGAQRVIEILRAHADGVVVSTVGLRLTVRASARLSSRDTASPSTPYVTIYGRIIFMNALVVAA